MEQSYNLKEIVRLDSMHDQRIQSISLENSKLIFHYDDVHFDGEMERRSCDIIFKGVNAGDVYAEVRKRSGLSIEGKVYYDEEFIQFISKNQYVIETINFYSGDLSVIVHAHLIDATGKYCEECIIKISAAEVQYLWK